MKIDLLFSGGGYRATLFHLGVLRFFYEHRFEDQSENESCLDAIELVSGVSGGSITACHFAANRDKYRMSFPDTAGKVLDFVTKVDLRRKVLRWGMSVSNVVRQQLFEKGFSSKSLPENLDLYVLGTSFKSGNCYEFSKNGVKQFCFDNTSKKLVPMGPGLPNAVFCFSKAIKASAAFPPFFSPLPIRTIEFESGAENEDIAIASMENEFVADGGVRDNLGIDWYKTLQRHSDKCRLVVVSNAGRPNGFDLDQKEHQTLGVWAKRLLRTVDIQMSRLYQLDASTLNGENVIQLEMTMPNDLPPSQDFTKPVEAQPLTRRVGKLASEIPTDLIPLKCGQKYAITKLGYDSAQKQFEKRNLIAVGRKDEFWHDLFPKNTIRLNDNPANQSENSLEGFVRLENNPNYKAKVVDERTWTFLLNEWCKLPFRSLRKAGVWVVNKYDLACQLPLRWWQWMILILTTLPMLATAAFGLWSLCKESKRQIVIEPLPPIEFDEAGNSEIKKYVASPMAWELFRLKENETFSQGQVWKDRRVRLRIAPNDLNANSIYYEVTVLRNEIGILEDSQSKYRQAIIEFQIYGSFPARLQSGKVISVEGIVERVDLISGGKASVRIKDARLVEN